MQTGFHATSPRWKSPYFRQLHDAVVEGSEHCAKDRDSHQQHGKILALASLLNSVFDSRVGLSNARVPRAQQAEAIDNRVRQ